MHKIRLNGTLTVSSDLFNRLRERGILTTSAECTPDFITYLQECIARDDVRCSISTAEYNESAVSKPIPKREELEQDTSEDDDEDENTTKHESLSSILNPLIDEVDLSSLRKGMNTLYQGG